jgi:hypothetical protein
MSIVRSKVKLVKEFIPCFTPFSFKVPNVTNTVGPFSRKPSGMLGRDAKMIA